LSNWQACRLTSTHLSTQNQNLGALDDGILEEKVMRLIEKKSLLGAKRVVASLIAASLALIISTAFASAFPLS
jgi:hypothetical protein